jgi:EAL domain-containing protein (putative c-di-GMP-specific phosphodiesterase class I)
MTDLLHQIKARGFSFDRFILEVTENCVIGRGNEEAIALLCELGQQGLALSLDDFGAGYASLKHLRELPLNEIKIDKSFTVDMMSDPGTAAIVGATLDLASKLNIRVVAEGIETEEQVDCLRAMGSIVGQGYYFGRPMIATEINSWIERGLQFVSGVHQIDTHPQVLIAHH